jgi:lambda repressor-like predicted transcriptional regulator
MTFSKWLLKKKRYQTLREFSRLIGVSPNTMRCWLYKDTQPRLDNLAQIVMRLSAHGAAQPHEIWAELLPIVEGAQH